MVPEEISLEKFKENMISEKIEDLDLLIRTMVKQGCQIFYYGKWHIRNYILQISCGLTFQLKTLIRQLCFIIVEIDAMVQALI